jgi:SAM-dependent methyltransferase
MDDVHAINARIASAYDLRPWIQEYPDAVDPALLQLFAQPYGGSGQVEDVLDLGCGTGSLLVKTARRTAGRLVGSDISAVSCARARENLAEFGERAEIVAADILDLKAEQLGQFDLIYCTGVIYVVPPDVRQHIVELIGQCLKPGGIALISYYAGPGAALRAHLARSLRAVASGADPLTVTALGRKALDRLRPAMRRESQSGAALRAAFKHFDQLNDQSFFAEALNGEFQAISTAELNHALRQFGVGFGTYLGFAGFKPTYSAGDRATSADRLDLTEGGFRYALFVRPTDESLSRPAESLGSDDPVAAGVRRPPLRRRVRRWLGHLFWLVFRV